MLLLFFGSDPWFSPPVLEALLTAGHEVPVIVTKGKALKKFMVHRSLFIVQAANEGDISEERLEAILRQSPITHNQSLDAIILASFGPPFLPDDLLDWPTFGCLNVHASLLPRWRGASPVSAAIAAGDKETGVSIMRMTKEIDRGAILGQKKTEIRQPRRQSFERTVLSDTKGRSFSEFDTRETLTRRLGILGGELIVETLQKLEKGRIIERSQLEKSPTPYTRRLTKESGRIDWSKTPEEIERFIRAMTPWPGAWTEVQAQRKAESEKRKVLRILKAHLEPLTMNSLTHQLILDEVQLPGKNPVLWKQFSVGHTGITLE